jgi:hypothetical protein
MLPSFRLDAAVNGMKAMCGARPLWYAKRAIYGSRLVNCL